LNTGGDASCLYAPGCHRICNRGRTGRKSASGTNLIRQEPRLHAREEIVGRFARTKKLTAGALFAGALVAGSFFGPALAEDLTAGPNGEKAVSGMDLSISDADAAKLKAGNYTAALMWHVNVDQMNAISVGATEEFAKYGIKVVATTDDEFDTAKQKNNFETVMAKNRASSSACRSTRSPRPRRSGPRPRRASSSSSSPTRRRAGPPARNS
jgi:hypothetical protein